MRRLPPLSQRPRFGAALAAALAGSVALAGADAAGESRRQIAGPMAAQVVRVLDGDTIEVLARIWPDHYVQTLVRLAGIDAPELRGRCADEVAAADRARVRLRELLGEGRIVLHDVHYGKYAGRVVARVATEDGRDAAAILLAENLARPGRRHGRRLPWCPE